jgi:hypothetical protein
MKSIYLLPLLLLTFSACVGKAVKNNLESNTKLIYPTKIQEIISKFPNKKLPFRIDSTFFKSDDNYTFKQNNLSVEHVKLLAYNLSTDEITSREKYYLNDFFKIERLKSSHKYAQFKKDINLGMTENASCNAIGKIEFGDSMAILIWDITYKSFDACPFYFGHHVMASLSKHGKMISCITLAAREWGADAPMSYEMYQLGEISNQGEISCFNLAQSNEDSVIIEKTKNVNKYKINSKGFEWKK